MTNTWQEKILLFSQENKVSFAVLTTAREVLKRLPENISERITLETSGDYGINIRWGTSSLEIHQAAPPLLFVWLTFDRHKSDKVTTSEERVFTDEETLYKWITRHSEELSSSII